jgi:hypothetical protein
LQSKRLIDRRTAWPAREVGRQLGTAEASPTAEDTGLESASGRPLLAFLVRLVGWLAILAVIGGLHPDRVISLMLVALADVTIVTDSRFGFERPGGRGPA